MVLRPEVLIVGSRNDFSCDYVVAHLASQHTSYLRLNSEDLPFHDLCLDPLRRELRCRIKNESFVIGEDTLRSIWFRRPVFLRDYGPAIPAGAADQINRAQWAAFIRGLMIFAQAKWINHPRATYLAEQKPVQLSIAQEIGFLVPTTLITNHSMEVARFGGQAVAIKGVDTVLAYEDDQEIFAFTNIVTSGQVATAELKHCPIMIQQQITPKIDIRVTAVDNNLFAASITKDGQSISGDWRLHKSGLSYNSCSLPTRVEELCRALTKRLGLVFGGIDLALRGDDYFFLEINPTGEWAWLVDSAGLRIDEAIAHALIS